MMIGGLALTVIALIMDISGQSGTLRGWLLTAGIILLVMGIFEFPNKNIRRLCSSAFILPWYLHLQ